MSASALRNHANLNSLLVKILMLRLSASDVSRVIVNLVGMTVRLMEKVQTELLLQRPGSGSGSTPDVMDGGIAGWM